MLHSSQRAVILLCRVDKRRFQAQTCSIRPAPAVVKSCREPEVNQQNPEPIASCGGALLLQLAERPGGRRNRAGKSTAGTPGETGLPRVLAPYHPAFCASSGARRVSRAAPRWSFRIGSFFGVSHARRVVGTLAVSSTDQTPNLLTFNQDQSYNRITKRTRNLWHFAFGSALLTGLVVPRRRLKLLDVLRRELRPVDREGDLVDLAGEGERDLVVLVVDRCAGIGADVEVLVPL
jgi:hypothetical protein